MLRTKIKVPSEFCLKILVSSFPTEIWNENSIAVSSVILLDQALARARGVGSLSFTRIMSFSRGGCCSVIERILMDEMTFDCVLTRRINLAVSEAERRLGPTCTRPAVASARISKSGQSESSLIKWEVTETADGVILKKVSLNRISLDNLFLGDRQ